MKKLFILINFVVLVVINSFGQLKVMKSGRVSIGSNNIDTIYKSQINGSNYCALSLVNTHFQDYQWSMIASANRALTKCYIVDYSDQHTFYVLGKGQVYCKEGIIADNLIRANNGIDVIGNLNLSNNLIVGNKISNKTLQGNTRILSPNIFYRIGAWVRSDSLVKKDVQPIVSALDKIGQLMGYTYRYKNDSVNYDSSLNGRYYGFIAQELKNVLPELVSKPTFDSVYYINYGNMGALLVEGVKALKSKSDSFQSLFNSMSNEISSLNEGMSDLQAQLQNLQSRIDNCCPSEQMVASSKFVGLAEEIIGFNVFPNPFNFTTRIEFFGLNQKDKYVLLVTDLAGKTINKLELVNNLQSILYDSSQLSGGIYLFNLICNSTVLKSMQVINEK